MIKVAIFEDNKPRRELLRLLIDSTDGLQCVGAWEDCRKVLQHMAETQPQVVLMDIDMPYVNGIEGITLIKSQFAQIKIIMQTVFEDDDKIFEAVCAGADGYLLKKTSPARLLEAIVEVMDGGAPMTHTVARQVLQLFNNKHARVKKVDLDLTKRELEILTLLSQGLSYKLIAEKCSVSYATVNTHISHIYEKLHVNNAVEAVNRALREGLV